MRMFEVNRKFRIRSVPLGGIDGNIITEGFLMAENLNEYFSSVFTREILVYYQYLRLSSKGESLTI